MYGFNAGTFDWQPLHPFQERMLRVLKGDIGIQESFNTMMTKGISATIRFWKVKCTGTAEWTARRRRYLSKEVNRRMHRLHRKADRYALRRHPSILGPLRVGGHYMVLRSFCYECGNPVPHHASNEACGYFRDATGILFGRVMFDGGSSDEDYLDLLTRCFDVPIILNCDIGHVKPCMTLINGSFATVQCGDGIGTIEMRLE